MNAPHDPPAKEAPDDDFDDTPMEKPAGTCSVEDGTCEACQ